MSDQEPRTVLEPGTVVRPKNGGPKMVVEREDGNDKVQCSWFTKHEHGWTGPYRESFPTATLEIVNDD